MHHKTIGLKVNVSLNFFLHISRNQNPYQEVVM